MVRLKVLAIMAIRQHHVLVQEFVDLQVGRVTAITMHENVTRLRLKRRQLHEIADLNPFPTVVIARPRGDAMKIRGLTVYWQLAEFVPTKSERIFNESEQAKIPFGGIKAGGQPVAEDRKTGHQ